MTDQTAATTAELDTDRVRVLSRLVDINAKIADLTSEAESLKAELRALPAGDYAVAGQPALRIIPTRRFDVDKAAGLLSVEQRKAALAVTYDPAEVKRHLTQVEIEECMIEAGKPKVTLL